MTDAILVLNAGSSTDQVSLFARTEPELTLVTHGQIEGLATTPRFTAQGPDGHEPTRHEWPADTVLGHDAAVAWIVGWLKQRCAARYLLVAAGHRVVHGGVA